MARGELSGGGKRVQLRRERTDQWTKAKRDRFIAELKATCNVAASCRAVGMSLSGLYQLRERSAEFRAQWAEAVREAVARLEMALLDRMINGTIREVRRSDGSVDRIREYSNREALHLLRLYKDQMARAEEPEEDVTEVRARLEKKLKAIARVREAEKAKEK